jgi:hypothetical protein
MSVVAFNKRKTVGFLCDGVSAISAMAEQIEVLAGQVEQGFGQHPDAEIYLSQPGLGVILGARVLAEFGDDPNRYADAKGRKNYSGMSADHQSLRHQTSSAGPLRPGTGGSATPYSSRPTPHSKPHPAPGRSTTGSATTAQPHYQALRALANRLVGILHGCLRNHRPVNTQPQSMLRQRRARRLDAQERAVFRRLGR